jgi:hypothetical protein
MTCSIHFMLATSKITTFQLFFVTSLMFNVGRDCTVFSNLQKNKHVMELHFEYTQEGDLSVSKVSF